jgi:Phospholipase_D-nuclease N-terminal
MPIAADYPFLDVMWTMFVFFMWVLWFWLLFTVFADVFRRHDLSGWGKAGWLAFTIVLPFLGVFVYLISQGSAMTQRNLERARDQRAQFDGYVRETASNGTAASEIDKAKQLLDSGTITQGEFQTLKERALAA